MADVRRLGARSEAAAQITIALLADTAELLLATG